MDVVLLYFIKKTKQKNKKEQSHPLRHQVLRSSRRQGLQSGVCLSADQQAEDCGRGMARSFLRPPFMCAYGGSSSRDCRIVTPEPVASPDPAARPAPDSPLAACWLEGCLSMAAVDVQGEEGELGASEGAGGASELGEGGVCSGTGACCVWVEEGGSKGTSSMLSILSR